MSVTVLTLCGSGVGTSAILKVAAERVLGRLGIDAVVRATDIEHVHAEADEAQVILATAEHVAAIGRTYAQIIVVTNILDQDELTEKLEAALG